jgi:hypothetical protein
LKKKTNPSAHFSSRTDVHQVSRAETAQINIQHSVKNSSKVVDLKRDAKIGTVTSCTHKFAKTPTFLVIVKSLAANNDTSRIK